MRDLASHLSPVVALAPAVYAATAASAAIDLNLFDATVILVAIGAGGITFDAANAIDVVLEHSDDGTTFAAVTADDLGGKDAPATVTDGIVLSLTAAHAAATVSEFGYIGGKRYLQLTAAFSGTHAAGTPMAAIVVRGAPRQAPVG